MPKKDLSLNKVSELCKKIDGENIDWGINCPELNQAIDSILKLGGICPSHEPPTPTWSDKLGQYPDLKESDVMDIYVFINGVPWQRK